MDLTEDEFEFIAAAITDGHYEFIIDDDEQYALFTDVEGDGYFMPSVSILHTVEDETEERQIVSDLLEQFDWLNYGPVEVQGEQEGLGHAYFEPASIKDKVREQVAEQLE